MSIEDKPVFDVYTEAAREADVSRRYAKTAALMYLYSPFTKKLTGVEIKNAIVADIKIRKRLGIVPAEDNEFKETVK